MKKKIYRIRRVTRPHLLSLRLSDEELLKLDTKVSKTSLSRSDYVRELLDLERRAQPPIFPEINRQVYSRLARMQHLLYKQSFGFNRLNEMNKVYLSHTNEFSAELARLVGLHNELLADVKSVKAIVLGQ